MTNPSRTLQELVDENAFLKQRIREMEQSGAERERVEETLKLREQSSRTLEEKKTGQALQDSEDKYRRLYESMMDAFVSVDMTGRIQEFNRAYQGMLGYPETDLKQLKYTDLTPEKWHAIESGIVREQIIPRGYSNIYEKEYRKKDGTVFPVELRTILIRDAVGQPCGMWAIIRDITARKRAEELLAESEARYRTIVENSNDAIYIHDFDGNILDVNENACRMVGYDRDELVGSNLSMIDGGWRRDPEEIHTDGRKASRDDLEQLLRDGEAVFERRNIRRNGSIIPVEVSVKIVSREGKGLVTGFVRDIAGRKQLEEDLQKHRRFLSDMIEHSGAIINVKDAGGRYQLVNRRWEEVTGTRREDAIGRTVEDVLPGPVGKQLHLNDLEVMKSKSVLETEETLETAGGKRFFLSVKFPLFDDRGNVTGVCGMITEITERKNAEVELEKSRSLLEEKVRDRTEALDNKTKILEEVNAALKVMLRHREEDKKELEERFVANIGRLVFPYVEKLKKASLNERQASYLRIIETHLNEITSPLLNNLLQFKLTPTEIRIASFVREGRTTREISEAIGIATSSIDTHRKSIRKKLGLDRGKNLQSSIQNMT